MSATVTKKQLAIIFKALGEYERRKHWFNFRCPYHNGSRLNFGVDIRAGIFKCLGCDEDGDLLRLYIDLRRRGGAASWGDGLLLPPDVSELTEGTPSPVSRPSEKVDHDSNTEWFWSGYHSCKDAGLHGTRSMERAHDYLIRRGVNPQVFEVGIHDKLPGRVVFPFFEDEKVVYYMGRAFENIPLKTVNPDSEKGWLQKSDVLWRLQPPEENIVVCEGIFDAIGVIRSASIWHSTCLLGKTISQKQIQILKECKPRKILVMLDSDADKDARSLGLRLYESGFETLVCQWGERFDGKDPGDAPIWQLNRLISGAKLITPELEFQWLLESA